MAKASRVGIGLSAFVGATFACAEPGSASPPVQGSAGRRAEGVPVQGRPEPAPRLGPAPNALDAGAPPPRKSLLTGAPAFADNPAPSVAPLLAAPSLAGDAQLAPELLAPDGAPLPQTRERPRSDSPGLRLRLERLVDAIAHDDPERALPAFFPRVAYQQVKAIADPARDWQERLVRAFQRDIHDYHRELGHAAAGARLAGISCNEHAVRWLEPGSEGNRIGYYRVTRSRLRLRVADGTERALSLSSLISWRGAWYVVHLNGFSRVATPAASR